MFGAITPVVHAGVAGTLSVSSTQFTARGIIEIKVVDADLNLNSTAYDTLQVSFTFLNSTGTLNVTALTLTETLANSGEFICYLGIGGVKVTPSSPPYGTNYYVYGINPNTILAGETFDLSYIDQSPSQTTTTTILYDVYESDATDISFDRSSGEYPMNGYIRINIKDHDYNYDPTTVDTVNLNWSLIDPVYNNATWFNFTFTETGVNTAIFRKEVSYWTSAYFDDYTVRVWNVSAGNSIKFTNYNQTAAIFKYITMKTFDPTFTIASSFTTNGDLTITVTDLNFNHRSWSRENFGSFVGTSVTVTADGDGDTVNVTGNMRETDYDTGVFTYVVPVIIGAVTASDGILQLQAGASAVSIKYYANGTLTLVTASSWSITQATVASDKTNYRSTATARITITAPDLNYDADNPNSLTCAIPGLDNTITSVNVNENGEAVGTMTVNVNGLTAQSLGAQTLVFTETGVDTHLFTASLDLTKVGTHSGVALTNGDTVQVSYYDAIYDGTDSVSFEIGVTAATIALDRETYPVAAPAIGAVAFKITVTDSDFNNASLIDTITTCRWGLYGSNGTIAGGFPMVYVSLTETGANTGIFTKRVEFGPFGATQTSMINGWIKVDYPDPSTGENVTDTGYFRATDGSITTNATSVQAGDTIAVTLTDADLNTYYGTRETPRVTFTYTNPDGNDVANLVLTPEETGANTGVFTKTVDIGKPFIANTTITPEPGSTITFTYQDWTPSTVTSALTTFPTTATSYTKSVTMTSFTGTVTLDKSEYGLGANVTVTVVDPDLNSDVTARQNVPTGNGTLILRISGQADVNCYLIEEGVSYSTFKYQNYKIAATDATLLGKTFRFYYKDATDASGNTVYMYATGTIKAWDAAVSFGETCYSVGDVATVIVYNPDNNTNPTLQENIQATVTSDSDPVGQTVTLTETGVNTGNFTGTIQISDSIASGKVYTEYGDTLTVTYTDKLPADYATTSASEDFTGTAVVGVPVSRPVPASDQKFTDPTTGTEVTSGTVGTSIGLTATITNVDVIETSYTMIFKVQDDTGATIFISTFASTVAPDQTGTATVSWTPSEAGDYTVVVLVVKTLAEPTPYSDQLSLALTVS
jgi:hypothetical protein